MSDSEQRQLHVPYREYQSKNNANSNLVETDALVDLSLAPDSTSLSISTPEILPDVEFITGLSNDQTAIIDSPGIDRESQPLLGRLELDVTFNRFPGKFESPIFNETSVFNFPLDSRWSPVFRARMAGGMRDRPRNIPRQDLPGFQRKLLRQKSSGRELTFEYLKSLVRVQRTPTWRQ